MGHPMAQESILGPKNMHRAPNGPVSVQDRIRRLHRPHGAKNRPVRKAILQITQRMRENVGSFVVQHDADFHIILDILFHALPRSLFE